MPRFVLVRHGESVWNGERRIQGHRDPPLSERGRRQADLVLARLAPHVGPAVGAVFTSPLRRAAETAERIAEFFRLPVIADPDLREMGLGAWEGMTVPEIQAAFPGAYERWLEDPLAAPAPGGEPLPAFAARTTAAFARMQAAHAGRDLILVSHGGVIKSLLCAVLGLETRYLFRLKQDNTAINLVEVGPAVRRVVLLNDTCHLTLAEDVAARDVLTDAREPVQPAL